MKTKKTRKRYKHLKKRRRRSLFKVILLLFSAVILSWGILSTINMISLGVANNDIKTDSNNIKEQNTENIDISDNNDDTNNNEINKEQTIEMDNVDDIDDIDDTDDNNMIESSNEVDNKDSKIDDNASVAKEVEEALKTWDFQSEDGKKTAYLTFDDGPSGDVTNEILDVLKAKNVKATFFVLGSMVEKSYNSKEALKRIVKEGHAIGNHGYCHRYDVLYPGGKVDPKIFMDDMKKSEDAMKSVLGNDFSTNIIRFPGGHGSWDTSDIDPILESQGYSYIDWNTLNGDAEGQNISPDRLLDRLKETVADIDGNNDVIVVLMHDTDAKETTAQYLSAAIDYLRSLGYEFKTLK